jgi:hypothetical protein
MVIHEETGLLTLERDPAAIASALTRLLQDPGLAHRFGQAGLALAQQRFAKAITTSQLRLLLIAFGKINGWPDSLPLLSAHLRQWVHRLSRTQRAPWHRKSPVFP